MEQQHVEQIVVSRPSSSVEVQRREQTLVLRYGAILEKAGKEVVRLEFPLPGEVHPIVGDLYEKTRNNLVEAKGTGSRGEVRMALGQLVDYGRFVAEPALAVLLPSRPRPDLEALLGAASVSAVWPEGNSFVDNANGRFV